MLGKIFNTGYAIFPRQTGLTFHVKTEMSNPAFWEKEENYLTSLSSAEFANESGKIKLLKLSMLQNVILK